MSMSFELIPVNIRPNVNLAEFDNSNALGGRAGINEKILMVGQKTSSGTVAAETLKQVYSTDLGDGFFGEDSQLAQMIRYGKAANPYSDMYAVALDDAGAATAAEGAITVSAVCSQNGTLPLYVDGRSVPVQLTTTMSGMQIASAIAEAINELDHMNVTAVASAAASGLAKVAVSAANAGLCGNDKDLRICYYATDKVPTGFSYSLTAFAGGATNPDLDDVWAVTGDEHFHHVISPYTDSANTTSINTELERKWGPLVQAEGRAYAAARGTVSALTSVGAALISKHLSILGAHDSPSNPTQWAAVYGAIAGYHLNIDPARPLQTLVLPGIMPASADSGNRFTIGNRNTLLWNGITPYYTDQMGQVMLDRTITTYQTNAHSVIDPSYLDVNTHATLGYIRYQVRYWVTNAFPRHKLADDGANFDPGQYVATPGAVKGFLIRKFRLLERAGIVENLDQFKEDIIVERNDTDKNRLDILLPPDLVNQLVVQAYKIQYIL